jgi:hypothetical protein
MTRELIAETEFYKLEADSAANRSYSLCRGFWPDTDEFKKNYLANMQKVIARLRPGFTTIVDIREMKIPPQGLAETILKVQSLQKDAGIKRSARISDQPIQTLASERMRREGEVEGIVRTFNSLPEALAWLDS